MATWTRFMFQDSVSPLMEQMIFFHDYIMFILILITSFVGYMLSTVLFNKLINRFMLEHQTIELIWTSIPAVILILIAFPSLQLLYILDETNSSSMVLKTTGHQWYWSYEYSDFLHMEFDSYMIPSNELSQAGFRLLDVDNRTVLPMNIQIRIIMTASDVIHSWTVPALSVKADAIPGRLNQASFLINRPGLYFGQCSEICGANHSFMPIVIESTSTNHFLNWVYSASN
uniref:cytochrome c oxidase subunit II n=1 Tax=Jonas distinctus TaxID=1550543 RepID=UPI0023F166A8|nr:cytochrome c oxidase subunit II [Jonas distinctus]WDV10182.1 cytochrome c oxidase subunit II [Jonas distinctus]WOR86753.1 cytochrome c oxidase subunit II [Jonas distinctus]